MLFAALILAVGGCQTAPDAATGTSGSAADAAVVGPDPSLTAREVVQIQLEAFADGGTKDEGIEIAFRFASPTNRLQTGPLERFAGMLRSPAYRIMLDYDTVHYFPLLVEGDLAVQRVILSRNGEVEAFDFVLRRQRGGPYEDCWMTESVLRLHVQQPRREQLTPIPPPISV